MKRISILMAAVLFIVLIFFTIFGDGIYKYITPKVKGMQVNSFVLINDMRYASIPKTALIDDNHVYTIIQEQGFSRTLYTVHKKEVSVVEFKDIDANSYFVDEKKLRRGTLIICQLDSDKEFEDGDRVIVE